MFVIDWLMRTAHVLAGAAWIGGSMMYLVVVRPALRLCGPPPGVGVVVAARFRYLTNLCIGVLLLSGGYLLFSRLTRTTLGWPYLLILVCKLAVVLAMFALALYLGQGRVRTLAGRPARFSQAAPVLLLALGLLVFGLGALLNLLFELTIAAG
jgi:putative copper export protein